ncbi:hypothetical protein AB1Y20_013634 [Prymnesium parvum]|uniref:ACB domain-containing protein n=1 Tax=Prymnesium parvum TaxID=97485 RepID=A0AB34IIU0_PRYPA
MRSCCWRCFPRERLLAESQSTELQQAAEPDLPVPSSSPAPPSPPLEWRHARPLAAPPLASLPPAVRSQQLAALAAARALSNASTAASRAAGADSIRILRTPHAHSPAAFAVDLAFDGSWHADVRLEVTDHGAGLLPILAMVHEADLLPAFLPKPPGLPHVEAVRVLHAFAPNDAMYHARCSAWGPFPGTDDVHNVVSFDLTDEPEGGVLLWVKSPDEADVEYRGWPIPPVTGWRRVRTRLLGAATILRPSAARAVSIAPPTAAPERCRSKDCPFLAHRCLSVGEGLYCCERCAQRPGAHSHGCERIDAEARGVQWAIAQHRAVHWESTIRLELPIPRWLIPTPLVRWAVAKMLDIIYPIILDLNERFDESVFAARVRDDVDGFYASLHPVLLAFSRLSSRADAATPPPARPRPAASPASRPSAEWVPQADGSMIRRPAASSVSHAAAFASLAAAFTQTASDAAPHSPAERRRPSDDVALSACKSMSRPAAGLENDSPQPSLPAETPEEVAARFDQAAATVRSLEGLDNETMLLLYGLFKQARGAAPPQPPSRLQMAARAKWEAWDRQRGLSREDAMSRYCALVEMLQFSQACGN